MQTLFPSIKPYAIHEISVSPLHSLYVEESGNPKGLPVVVLHGGPGGGTTPEQRRFFDPALYRIILFDQRGAGQSKPHAELTDNTTQDLVSDMEVIRLNLNIERWVLFGGSWGSTLALIYAQTHPERVLSLILRGIFLARQQDLDWFYKQGGVSRLFPEAWQEFSSHFSKEEQENNLIESSYKILTGQDELARMAIAKAWSHWEGVCSTLLPNHELVDHFVDPHVALSLARIEAHYFFHRAFLEPNQILNHAPRLKDIPGIIVHGRYDVVCPFDNAHELHKAWPRSELMIVRDAGHSAFEPGNVCALVNAARTVVKLHS